MFIFFYCISSQVCQGLIWWFLGVYTAQDQIKEEFVVMQFRLRCNAAIFTLHVMQQRLQMQQLHTELNMGLQILIWVRVSFYIVNQVLQPFYFLDYPILNFDPLICYIKSTFFFSIGFFNNFSCTHFYTSFINIIVSSTHTCFMGIWLIIYVFFVIIFLVLEM